MPDNIQKLWNHYQASINLRPEKRVLRAGRNRPNNAELGFEKNGHTYVKGLITHQGREHKPIKLLSWYRVEPNTGVDSYQITGDVD